MPKPTPTAEDHARAAIRAALRSTGRTQLWLAGRLYITTKHMSHMLTGRARISGRRPGGGQ